MPALFFAAMALHFVGGDSGLRECHGQQYHRRGDGSQPRRWVLDWVVGITTEIREAATAVAIGLLAGEWF